MTSKTVTPSGDLNTQPAGVESSHENNNTMMSGKHDDDVGRVVTTRCCDDVLNVGDDCSDTRNDVQGISETQCEVENYKCTPSSDNVRNIRDGLCVSSLVRDAKIGQDLECNIEDVNYYGMIGLKKVTKPTSALQCEEEL